MVTYSRVDTIDDWEDQDKTTKSSTWAGWNNDTDKLTISSTAAEGSYSGRVEVTGDKSHYIVADRGSEAQVDRIGGHMRFYESSGSGSTQKLGWTFHDGTGDTIGQLYYDSFGGEVEWVQPDAGQGNAINSVSLDTWYEYDINFDWANDTVEIFVDGSSAGSFSMDGSFSGLQSIRLYAEDNYNRTRYLYTDDLAIYEEVTEPAAPNNVQQEVEDDDASTVTWDEDTSGGDPTEYEVDISTDGGSWTRVADLGGSARSHIESVARATDSIRFRVRAVNSAGASSWSYTSTETTNVSGLQIDAVGETSIDISWSDPTANDGTDILLAQASGSTAADYSVVESVGATASSASITGLENGERYYARVQATYTGADGTPSPVSNEVNAVTSLPAPTLDSLDAGTEGEITLSYTLSDNSTDGDVLIERSTDSGSTWSEVATITDLSQTAYTDTGLLDGERYTYRVTRRTDHTSSQSGTLAATTILPAPSDVATSNVTATSVDASWTVNANNGTQRVEYRRTSDSAWSTDASGLATSTTSETVSGLLNGEAYDVRVVAVTDHDESPSAATSATTVLPDEDQPVLGNGVEDEIAVDRETQPTNYGSIRIHYRETGASSWIDWGTIPFDQLTESITGLEDGEEYEVRLRSETEHDTGDWTSATSIITKFPGATNLAVDSVTATAADLSWSDNSDNEDGFIVERREQFRGGFESWRERANLAPNTTTYTDDVLPETTYEYRVQAYTEHTSATSGTVQTTSNDDGVRTDRVPAEGWHVVVEDTAGNQITPTIVGEPVHRPRLNDLPTVEIPVPDSARWSDSAEWERQPMRVYYDGERLPIEQVQRVRQEPGQAMLVGVGGIDLRERVSVDVIEQDAHLTAEDLIQTETGLVPHVDDPNAETTADLLQQSADSDAEWDDVLETLPGSSDVYETTSTGELRTRQTAYFAEAEDGSVSQGSTISEQSSDRWSGGRVVDFDQPGLDATNSVTVETDHVIPESNVAVAVLTQQPGDGHLGFDVSLDGTTLESIPSDVLQTGETEPDWYEPTTGSWSGDLAAGSHTVEMQFDESSSGDDPSVYVDAILLYDDRYDPNLSASPTVTDNVLQDLHEYPSGIQAQTVDAVSVRQVTGGRLEATINDTTGSQAVAMSNDSGATWIEATNSDGNFIFEVRWDPSEDGLAVEWTQAGQRTATVDPDLVDYSTEVDYSSIHRRAVIYGTSVPRSSQDVVADLDTWQSLDDQWLLETGERVVDSNTDQEYERSQDYELRPNAGEIKPLSTGDIDDGDALDVSYDRRIRGTFESEDYAGDYEVFIDDVPSITTERNADAAALAIVQETNEPLRTASVTVDVQPGGMSLVEAVDLDQLPVDEPLEVWSVDNSPGQVTMQLGNREEVSETVWRIQERLGATSRKV